MPDQTKVFRIAHGYSIRLECPWCGVIATTTSTTTAATQISGAHGGIYLTVVCADRECGRKSLVVVHGVAELGVTGALARVYPHKRSTYAPIGVDSAMASDVREAQDSYASGYFLGAALVGRRVLQAAARSVVGRKASLKDEIDALPVERVPAFLREAAHQVRLIGNEAAHTDPVSDLDAYELLDYTEQILDALFVQPARVRATQARRAGATTP